jgi:hypothetical protein
MNLGFNEKYDSHSYPATPHPSLDQHTNSFFDGKTMAEHINDTFKILGRLPYVSSSDKRITAPVKRTSIMEAFNADQGVKEKDDYLDKATKMESSDTTSLILEITESSESINELHKQKIQEMCSNYEATPKETIQKLAQWMLEGNFDVEVSERIINFLEKPTNDKSITYPPLAEILKGLIALAVEKVKQLSTLFRGGDITTVCLKKYLASDWENLKEEVVSEFSNFELNYSHSKFERFEKNREQAAFQNTLLSKLKSLSKHFSETVTPNFKMIFKIIEQEIDRIAAKSEMKDLGRTISLGTFFLLFLCPAITKVKLSSGENTNSEKNHNYLVQASKAILFVSNTTNQNFSDLKEDMKIHKKDLWYTFLKDEKRLTNLREPLKVIERIIFDEPTNK